MLVLTRKAREEIVIGDDIRVIVKQISGRRVSIGVIAPPETTIRRKEIQKGTGDARTGNC